MQAVCPCVRLHINALSSAAARSSRRPSTMNRPHKLMPPFAAFSIRTPCSLQGRCLSVARPMCTSLPHGLPWA